MITAIRMSIKLRPHEADKVTTNKTFTGDWVTSEEVKATGVKENGIEPTDEQVHQHFTQQLSVCGGLKDLGSVSIESGAYKHVFHPDRIECVTFEKKERV